MVLDHLFQDVPHLLVLPLQHLLGALDRVGVAELLQAADDERLVQLQGDFLRQAALVQPQRGADDDHAAGGVIDALAQQVLAEPALLALDHVGQRFQRAVAAAQHGPLAAVVVEQGVDRLLQHPLLVADDHFGGVQVDQLLQPVVAVDDPPVEVVQVAGGEIARVQQHQRPQVGRDHRNHVQHHPLRPVVAVADRLDDLQPVDQVLLLLLRVGLDQLDAQVDWRASPGRGSPAACGRPRRPCRPPRRRSGYWARAARYSSSVSNWRIFSGVSPGLVTT